MDHGPRHRRMAQLAGAGKLKVSGDGRDRPLQSQQQLCFSVQPAALNLSDRAP
jgi:hypothetical protein